MIGVCRDSVVGIAVAAVLIALVEWVVRQVGPFPLSTAPTYQVDTDVLYFHRPGSVGFETSPVREFDPVRVGYDDGGFRVPPRRVSISDGATQRPEVVLLGDSFVEARQVAAEESAAGLLARELPNFQLINAGCSAYTTTTEYLLLLHRLVPLGPRRIYLFFAFNDYRDNAVYEGGYYHATRVFETGRMPASYVPSSMNSPSRDFSAWLVAHSAIYANAVYWLRRPAVSFEPVEPMSQRQSFARSFVAVNKPVSDMNAEELAVLRFTHQGILEMARLARREAVELTVVIIPLPLQVGASEWRSGKRLYGWRPEEAVADTRYQRRLAAFLEEHEIPFIDLLPPFRARTADAPLHFSYDGHWTRAGNRVVADAIVRDLTEHPLGGRDD